MPDIQAVVYDEYHLVDIVKYLYLSSTVKKIKLSIFI